MGDQEEISLFGDLGEPEFEVDPPATPPDEQDVRRLHEEVDAEVAERLQAGGSAGSGQAKARARPHFSHKRYQPPRFNDGSPLPPEHAYTHLPADLRCWVGALNLSARF